MHVHFVLDTTREWAEEQGDADRNYEIAIPTEIAFLKHIRPSTFIGEEDNVLHHVACKYGEELDPGGFFTVD